MVAHQPTGMVQGLKYVWRLPQQSDTFVHLSGQYNLSQPVIQTLHSRGFVEPRSVESFLFTSRERDVHDASLLKDAAKAVDRILYAIDHKEKILIFGDYDVDGITSSALMMHALLGLGATINFFLPHRVRDGYGLSERVVERAAANGYKVIITVDNGITAYGPAARAKELGIDLIITDHHQPKETVPDAFAIVNPHQSSCLYPYKKFAGVGVTFKLLSLLYERKNMTLPDKAYELLLLGTIADVVPLTGENRFWVRHGLQMVNERHSAAFSILKRNGNITKDLVTSIDIGFSITPQINALGRLEDPRQGVSFLIGEQGPDIERIGKTLFELNQARKEIERSVLASIVAQVESGALDVRRERVIVAASSQWPPGVIGLVASRLVGMYSRPAILLHVGTDGIAKGSCRSITGFNILSGLQMCQDLLEKFGGHTAAAGLSLKTENIPLFKERLEEYAACVLTEEGLRPSLTLDADLLLSDVTKKLMSDLCYLEPFGHENPQPLFYVPRVTLLNKPTLLKGAHVKCQMFADGVIKPVIFFNRPELFEWLLEHEQDEFSLAAQVSENHWNGTVSFELVGLDIAVRGGA